MDLYWERVFAYAYRLTYNKIDAEDITQETFLRAFRNLAKYTPDAPFKSWLLRIATNLFLDYKKSAQNRDVISGEMSQYMRTAPSAETIADQRELLTELWEVIQTLTKEQQVVILLRAVERLDYPEIAGMLDIKESTARWHMYEARRILRRKLSRKFDLVEGENNESGA